MFCEKCGTNLGENINYRFCPRCGYDLTAKKEEAFDSYDTKKLKIRAFMNNSLNSAIKRDVVFCAIVLYICSGMTLLSGILGGNYLIVIDVLILLGMALGIHLAYSRACSIIVLCYSVVNLFASLFLNGNFSGYLIVIASIYAVISTFKARKKYNRYIETNIIEDNSIETAKRMKKEKKLNKKNR